MSIAIATLPGIAILKLFAWADRGQADRRDAVDLVTLLRSYNEAGNASRIYEEASALAALEAAGYDLELAGAWLLGNDAAAMVSAQTNADLGTLPNGPSLHRSGHALARAMLGRDDSLEYSDRLLEQFTIGFTA